MEFSIEILNLTYVGNREDIYIFILYFNKHRYGLYNSKKGCLIRENIDG